MLPRIYMFLSILPQSIRDEHSMIKNPLIRFVTEDFDALRLAHSFFVVSLPRIYVLTTGPTCCVSSAGDPWRQGCLQANPITLFSELRFTT